MAAGISGGTVLGQVDGFCGGGEVGLVCRGAGRKSKPIQSNGDLTLAETSTQELIPALRTQSNIE